MRVFLKDLMILILATTTRHRYVLQSKQHQRVAAHVLASTYVQASTCKNVHVSIIDPRSQQLFRQVADKERQFYHQTVNHFSVLIAG